MFASTQYESYQPIIGQFAPDKRLVALRVDLIWFALNVIVKARLTTSQCAFGVNRVVNIDVYHTIWERK